MSALQETVSIKGDLVSTKGDFTNVSKDRDRADGTRGLSPCLLCSNPASGG